jgi:hypothetical protein
MAVVSAFIVLALVLTSQRAQPPGTTGLQARSTAPAASASATRSDMAPSPGKVATAAQAPGDNAAATSRLFHFRMLCARVLANAAYLEQLSKDPNSWVNNDATAKLMDAQSLEGWRDAVAEVEANREACQQLGEATNDGSIYDIALRAANAGDGDAATCYIMTRWPTPKDPNFRDQAVGHTQMGVLPRFISDYRQNARRLLDEGLRRGDWRMVSLLNMVYNERHGQLIGGLRSLDPPDEEYVNLKLMLLGTRGDKVQDVSGQVEWALQQVPANRVAAANARAQQMYDRYFADKGPYQWGFGGCR